MRSPYIRSCQIQLDEKVVLHVHRAVVNGVRDAEVRRLHGGPPVGIAQLLKVTRARGAVWREIPKTAFCTVGGFDRDIDAIHVRTFALLRHDPLDTAQHYVYAYKREGDESWRFGYGVSSNCSHSNSAASWNITISFHAMFRCTARKQGSGHNSTQATRARNRFLSLRAAVMRLRSAEASRGGAQFLWVKGQVTVLERGYESWYAGLSWYIYVHR